MLNDTDVVSKTQTGGKYITKFLPPPQQNAWEKDVKIKRQQSFVIYLLNLHANSNLCVKFLLFVYYYLCVYIPKKYEHSETVLVL